MNSIAITGYSSLSALGNSNDSFREAFLRDETGVSNHIDYSNQYRISPFLLALSKDILKDRYQTDTSSWKLNLENEKAIYTVSEALENANYTEDYFQKHENTGIILAATYSGTNDMWNNLNTISNRGIKSIRVSNCMNGLNSVLGSVCSAFKLKGYNNIYVGSMLSSYSALKCAYDRIITKKNKTMLILGCDLLSNVLVRSVYKLGLVTGECFTDRKEGETGIAFGEAFGALVLEDVEQAKKRGAKIYAYITGIDYGSNIQTENPLKKSMQNARNGNKNIDFIYASSSCNYLFRKYEVKAIQEFVNEEQRDSIYITSLKSMLGETLSSSGVLQVIGAIESMNHNFLPSVHNLYDTTNDYKELKVVHECMRNVPLQAGLVNGMDLQGNCCYSVCIEKN